MTYFTDPCGEIVVGQQPDDGATTGFLLLHRRLFYQLQKYSSSCLENTKVKKTNSFFHAFNWYT